ncbi:hypothetical protein [Magnetospira sp. QH-2]|uniref:hypothetical protein n=1 Tax=Magnetospira sp. (strain QH-2) TaxID=1288970 RepID=UPI0003E81454|nr:hypothetical protein [Magnetospira sp. QH-2]CCQ72007.1 protein of unknown function [Magnetospira sp. QH-2]
MVVQNMLLDWMHLGLARRGLGGPRPDPQPAVTVTYYRNLQKFQGIESRFACRQDPVLGDFVVLGQGGGLSLGQIAKLEIAIKLLICEVVADTINLKVYFKV